MAWICGDEITEKAITPASLNSNCPGAGRSTMPSRLSARLSILARLLKSSLSSYSLSASESDAGVTPRQGPVLGYLDKASRGRGITRAGIWLRGKRSGEVPGARSGECEYDAIAVVGAADGEKLIDCNDWIVMSDRSSPI